MCGVQLLSRSALCGLCYDEQTLQLESDARILSLNKLGYACMIVSKQLGSRRPLATVSGREVRRLGFARCSPGRIQR